jgi:hypothetical protein
VGVWRHVASRIGKRARATLVDRDDERREEKGEMRVADREQQTGGDVGRMATSTTRRRFLQGLALGAGAMALPTVGRRAAVAAPAAQAWTPLPVLNGEEAIDANGLADLAYERALLGARWLAGVVRPNGSFYYVYDPGTDTYESDAYNEVRHAGTTASLFQVFDAIDNDVILTGGEAGARYIAEAALPVTNLPGRGFGYEGAIKLGGQALAVLALTDRRQATQEQSYDDLLREMAEFMLALELPDEPGRYYQLVSLPDGERLLEPSSDYYPGEALLAFTRLARQFPDAPYFDAAKRAAEYLIHVRDGDLETAERMPREDHWLTIALSELYRLDPNEAYLTVAYKFADALLANQYKAEDGYPQRIGASRAGGRISYTSTATKGEALVAAWGLATFVGDQDAIARFSAGTQRNIQFQLRVQFTEENTELFPRPDRAIGGWGQNAADASIRIDYVQHNISGLIGLWHLTKNGDLPLSAEDPSA